MPQNFFERPPRRLLGSLFALMCGVAPLPHRLAAAIATPETLFPALSAILTQSLSQSPRMVQKNLDRLSAEQLIDVSSARLYPQANAYTQYNYQQEATAAGSTTTTRSGKWYYNFSASQPLYHWGALKAGSDMGKIDADLANKDFASAYRGLSVEIRSQYLSLILSKVALRDKRFDVAMAEKSLAVLEARVATGQATTNGLAVEKAMMDGRHLELEKAERGFSNQVRQFRKLAGLAAFAETDVPDGIPQFAPVATEEIDPYRVNYVEKGGIEQDLRYLMLEARMRKEKLNVRIQRTALRPMLDFAAGVSQDELNYTATSAQKFRSQITYVGLRVSWNLFDGHASRGYLRAAQTNIRALENQLTDLDDDLRQNAEQLAIEVKWAAEELRLAEFQLNATSGALAAARVDLNAGRASQAGVDGLQSAYNGDELRAFGARARYLVAVVNFLSNVNADGAVTTAVQKFQGD